MSATTLERPIERTSEALSEQAQRATIASPQPYWPLPGTQLPNAHFTWPEWAARLQARPASASVSSEEVSPVLV